MTRVHLIFGFNAFSALGMVHPDGAPEMTLAQALTSLFIPAHFSDWYLSSAAQGTHLIFGVLAFSAIAWADDALGQRLRPHLVMLAAMCAVASWKAMSLAGASHAK